VRKKSSAYALSLISVCKDIMSDSLLNAMRNNTIEIGDPCGSPLVRGSEFDVWGPTRTINFLFSIKFLT